MTANRIVPDTSIMIDGKLTSLIEAGDLDTAHIIISEMVVDELENQANKGMEIGDAGLAELQKLQKKAEEHDIEITFSGRRPTTDEIEMAASGRIDALIRDIAEDEDATLYTGDRVQAEVAEAKGIDVQFFEQSDEVTFRLLDYFEEGIMSVHLKQAMVPKAKEGEPGSMDYRELADEQIGYDEIDALARQTYEKAQASENGLVELDMEGATVLQIDDLRIAITRPPFSEAIEITAVRPVAKLSLEDYELSDKLKQRLRDKAEGILIAGAPGHGKSTFAQALAEFYDEQGKVVKSMEHPRDLQVGPEITQYSALEGEMENTADVLLLVRPDYTVFDEVRKTDDFETFADMRLAGVGMIGVVHASEALDAVQRLIGRVDMGVIPQVVDTVIFIKDAGITKIYKLELTVKMPTGMQEQDLARPVVQVRDFETDEPEYEIYTYGEETVIVPVQDDDGGSSRTQELAEKQLRHQLKQYVDNPQVEFDGQDRVKLYVDEDDIPHLIGKNGENIQQIEDDIGLSITVEPRDTTLKDSITADVEEVGNSVALNVGQDHAGREADVYRGDEHLFTATIGKNGQIRLTKQSEMAGQVLGAYAANNLDVRL